MLSRPDHGMLVAMKTEIVLDHGKYVILNHPPLKGLTFADRKHAEAFLIRVRRLESSLERALRDAILATK